MCAILDCLKIIRLLLFVFLSKVIILVKQKIGDIHATRYHREGAPSQYKSYKIFVNLFTIK